MKNNRWLDRVGQSAWLWLPVVVTVVFVQQFARALPLTDEWFYIHRLWHLHEIDWGTLAGWREAWHIYPVQVNEHLVATPFLFYWPLAELSNFDSRWPIYLTVVSFAGQALLYRRFIVSDARWAWLIALVMLSPAHYMEFLWGWQITLSLSVFFPIAGLVILDRVTAEQSWQKQAGLVAAGWLALVLGAFSSAGGFMGFLCALVMVVLKPWKWAVRAAVAVLAVASAGVVYQCFLHDDARHLMFGARQVWQVLTLLGAALWSSPGGLTEFGFDGRSFGGILVVLGSIGVVGRAMLVRQLPRLALPVCLMVFGYLCVIPIALSRSYLGNWHVQYALPAVCGVFASAWALRRVDPSRFSNGLFVFLAGLLATNLGTYFQAFSEHGPGSLAYSQRIENYALNNLRAPGRPQPYPPQNLDLDVPLTLFLSAHEHAMFAALAPTSPRRPLPEKARVYLGDTELSAPWHFQNNAHKTIFLTVALPAGHEAEGVVARFGDVNLVLRRVHLKHVSPAIPDDRGEAFYMGMVIPSRWPRGEIAPQFETYGALDAQPWKMFEPTSAHPWTEAASDPFRFAEHAGMNLFTGRMTPSGNDLFARESRRIRYLGSNGSHGIRLNFGLYRLQGEMIAELGVGPQGEGKVSFEVLALGADGPNKIWEETVTVSREQPRFIRPFSVSPGGRPVLLSVKTESSAVQVGWRGLVAAHAGELEVEPPVPFSLPLPESVQPAGFGASLFAGGEPARWPVRVYSAEPVSEADGVRVATPSELWVRVDQPRNEISGAVVLTAWPGTLASAEIVRVQVVYYKSGRLHLLSQQDYSMNDLLRSPQRHEFKSHLPEPVGWIGLILKPLNPADPVNVSGTWSQLKLTP